MAYVCYVHVKSIHSTYSHSRTAIKERGDDVLANVNRIFHKNMGRMTSSNGIEGQHRQRKVRCFFQVKKKAENNKKKRLKTSTNISFLSIAISLFSSFIIDSRFLDYSF
ncbi:hypothetical protein DM02DRAFT_243633 [Periconia macrospinosa]|uniref:Uncharacterized protein n=1 Tax=Periconia macrospinosa TaxID=97972 RepID=A0A2V1D7T1_9PLEO|nr:hypothetical protein DM02DRAFT_243633 [Periconia macrospinosa]